MGGIFNLDSPLMRALTKVADLMILNIVALICCIPIFTIGASLTALNYMALKIVRGEDCYIVKGFFKSFKQNFKQATLIWLMLFAAIIILLMDFFIMKNSGLEFHIVLKVFIGIMGVAIVFLMMWVFPVLAKFDNTIKRTIKNALIMSLLQLPKTILMAVLYVIPIGAAILFPQIFPIGMMFCLSAPAWVSAMLYNKFLQKLEDRVMEENALSEEEGEEPEEDERIFKDELDEALIASQENQDFRNPA